MEAFLFYTQYVRRSARVILGLDMASEEPRNYWQPPEETVATPGAPVADTPFQGESEQPPVELRAPQQDTPDNPPITWSAEEYVHSERGGWWFVLFILVVVGFVAISTLVLQSWSFSALIVVMAIALVIYIRRAPRTLTYALSPVQGLYIGERLYDFGEFKSFGLIKDGERYSVMLIPRKRFATGVSVFFPEEVGERVVDILGQRLPMETLKLDVVDAIVRKLRL